MFEEHLRLYTYKRKATLCPLCYKPDIHAWCEKLGQHEPDDERICSDCDYWYNKILNTCSYRSIRINGHLYYEETNPNPQGFQPFNGRKFLIRRSGIVEQVMMWDNGEIPDWARDDLWDNAEWVK